GDLPACGCGSCGLRLSHGVLLLGCGISWIARPRAVCKRRARRVFRKETAISARNILAASLNAPVLAPHPQRLAADAEHARGSRSRGGPGGARNARRSAARAAARRRWARAAAAARWR